PDPLRSHTRSDYKHILATRLHMGPPHLVMARNPRPSQTDDLMDPRSRLAPLQPDIWTKIPRRHTHQRTHGNLLPNLHHIRSGERLRRWIHYILLYLDTFVEHHNSVNR